MRILDWLHGRPGNSTGNVVVAAGDDRLVVAGELSYQPNLRAIVGQRHVIVPVPVLAILVPEQDNRHDRDAVAVWVDRRQAGQLDGESARLLRPGLLRMGAHHRTPIAMHGRIDRTDGGALGLFLDYNRAEFGLPPAEIPPPPENPPADVPEPVSVAVEKSFEPAWRAALSDDPAQRLSRLRDLVLTEKDPISRHYVFDELEETLYAQREVFPSALDDFDITCRRHDAEMAVIIPALRDKHDEIRLLDLYRRAAQRHLAAGEPMTASWWIERAKERYGFREDNLPVELIVLEAKLQAESRIRSVFERSPAPVARPVTESVPDPARHTVTEDFQVPG
jgi:hypothetical protein